MVKESKTTDNINFTATTGYCAIVPMTYEEKVKMYMRLPKLDLARMMASRDEIDALRTPIPYTPIWPSIPTPYPYEPVITYSTSEGIADIKADPNATIPYEDSETSAIFDSSIA